jgi:hypothetical protein
MALTPDRLIRNRNSVATITAAGLVAFAAAVAFPAAAVADPPPPPDLPPAPAEPAAPPVGPTLPVLGAPIGSSGLNVLAQSGQAPVAPSGAFGAPAVTGLDRNTILGQLPAPAAPGDNPGTPPSLNPFNNGYGIGQCLAPSAPGKCEQFDVAPGQENADVSRREWFGRYIDMYRAGMLKGGLLGQMPQQQLGEPLPGTAPLPGASIPSGLGQYLPDPPAPPDGAPPAPAPAPPVPAPPG